MTITIKSNSDGVSGAIQVNGNDAVVFDTQGITQGTPLSFRNKIINGNMHIAQRSSSGTAPINQYTPTLDRWMVDPSGGPVDWGHGGTPFSPAGLPLGSLVATAGVGVTGVNMRQRIESVNAYMLAQKKVTVSFYVYGNGTTGATCTPSLSYANSSDNFSAITTIQTGDAVPIINGAFTKYSFTFNALPDAAAQGLQLSFIFKGLSQGKAVALGGVQLEEGEFATPFEHRPYGLELSLCQRYYESGIFRHHASGISNYAGAPVFFRVEKRVSPSTTIKSTIGSTASGYITVDGVDKAGSITALGTGGLYISIANQQVYTDQFLSATWYASAEL